jgi:hypothetical protein
MGGGQVTSKDERTRLYSSPLTRLSEHRDIHVPSRSLPNIIE